MATKFLTNIALGALALVFLVNNADKIKSNV